MFFQYARAQRRGGERDVIPKRVIGITREHAEGLAHGGHRREVR